MRLKYYALLLCACASSAQAYRPTMDADSTMLGVEGGALVNEMLAAFETVKPDIFPNACDAILPAFQDRDSETYRRIVDPVSGKPKHNLICLQYKRKIDAGDVERYVNAGFALSDLYCDIFFRRISVHSSKRRFARGLVNDVGGAISAVLGLSGAGGAVTGGIGAAFGLADGTFRNYEDSFLVASDLPNLQTAVLKKQGEYRAEIAKAPPLNYPNATSTIIHYANYCSFTGMRAIINAKLVEQPDPAKALEAMSAYITKFQALAAQLHKPGDEQTGTDDTSGTPTTGSTKTPPADADRHAIVSLPVPPQ